MTSPVGHYSLPLLETKIKHNIKKLSSWWNSATCERLDAMQRNGCRRSAKLHSFPHAPHWSFSVEFGTTGYYDPGRLRHAGSQDTDLSCHVTIYTFCCTVWSQSTNVTDRRTEDRQTEWHVAIIRKTLKSVARKIRNVKSSFFSEKCHVLCVIYDHQIARTPCLRIAAALDRFSQVILLRAISSTPFDLCQFHNLLPWATSHVTRLHCKGTSGQSKIQQLSSCLCATHLLPREPWPVFGQNRARRSVNGWPHFSFLGTVWHITSIATLFEYPHRPWH